MILNFGTREDSWEYHGQPRKQRNGTQNKSEFSAGQKLADSDYPTLDMLHV